MVFMPTRLASRLDRAIAPRLFALLAAVALLAPALARLAGPDGLAWLPSHGHLFMDGQSAAHRHSHPWDRPAASTPAAAGGGSAGVVFTPGTDGGVDSVAALALPVSAALLLVIAWLTQRFEAPRFVWAGRSLSPLVPPPQG